MQNVFGEAKNSWLTGTASWNFVAISQFILGIQPDFDGLKINPCIPKEWDGYKVKREFRGDVFEIEVKNPSHVFNGIKELTVDGSKVDGNVLPVFGDGKTHTVIAVMG